MEKKKSDDRISNLPWDVLANILVLLPFKEAVSTSILSSKWRNKWTDLSQFVIDDKCFPRFITDKVARGKMLRKFFHQVQLNHCGPVEKFKLAAYCRPDHSDLDQWISFLVAKGVKEFVLHEFDSVVHFKVPSCLLFCSQLNHLELFGCIIKLNHAIHGLNNLATLKLSEVHIDSDTLGSLILNCPVLEKLTLLRFPDPIVFKIHNPNLKHLNIDSQLRDICLENTFNLTIVQICLRLPNCFQTSKVPHLVRIIGCLKSAKELVLSGIYLKFMNCGSVPQKLPSLLNNLSILHLKDVMLADARVVSISLSILASTPNLEELHISIEQSFSARASIDQLRQHYLVNFVVNHLKAVKLGGISFRIPEMEFLKYVLAHSPVLETVTIVRYKGRRVSCQVLQSFDRASERVKFNGDVVVVGRRTQG